MGAFGTLLALALNIYVCVSVMNVSGAVAEAKEFKADVIAEIENSNFNQKVIDSCIVQAQLFGYSLQVISCTYDERHDMRSAEVILSYQYEIPLLGISEIKTTRGIAR